MTFFFITGTDTGIGKTTITCHLLQQLRAQGLRVLVLKPVASGTVWHQNRWVTEDRLVYEPYLEQPTDYQEGWVFKLPIAPHLAAEQEGYSLTAVAIAEWCLAQIKPDYDYVLIEGAGGWRVPLNDQETWVHVVKRLQAFVIWVVGLRLGCINHAQLTEEALYIDQVPLLGWIANHCDAACLVTEQIAHSLKKHLQSPFLGEVAHAVSSHSFKISLIELGVQNQHITRGLL